MAFSSRDESKTIIWLKPSACSCRARTRPPIPPPTMAIERGLSIDGIFRIEDVSLEGDGHLESLNFAPRAERVGFCPGDCGGTGAYRG